MKYKIETLCSNYWEKKDKDPEAFEELTGTVSIFFNDKKGCISHREEFVFIPVFLTELRIFYNILNDRQTETLYMDFAQYAEGIIRKGKVFIGFGEGQKFWNNIVDVDDIGQIEILKKIIDMDMKKYGSLNPTCWDKNMLE